MRDKSQANISDFLEDGRNASIGHNYVPQNCYNSFLTKFKYVYEARFALKKKKKKEKKIVFSDNHGYRRECSNQSKRKTNYTDNSLSKPSPQREEIYKSTKVNFITT